MRNEKMTALDLFRFVLMPGFLAYLYVENLRLRHGLLLITSVMMIGYGIFNVYDKVQAKRRAKMDKAKAEAKARREEARLMKEFEQKRLQKEADLFWERNFSKVVSWADEVGKPKDRW